MVKTKQLLAQLARTEYGLGGAGGRGRGGRAASARRRSESPAGGLAPASPSLPSGELARIEQLALDVVAIDKKVRQARFANEVLRAQELHPHSLFAGSSNTPFAELAAAVRASRTSGSASASLSSASASATLTGSDTARHRISSPDSLPSRISETPDPDPLPWH